MTREKASILTESQREMIRGEKELSDRGERAARSRIRERLRHAILDFDILLSHYDPEELAAVMDTVDNSELAKAGLVGSGGIANGVGFLMAAWFLTSINKFNRDPSIPSDYEPIVRDGIGRACQYHGFTAESIDLEFDVRDSDQIAQEDLTTLSFRTLRELWQSGEITTQEFDETVETQLDRGAEPSDRE